jgi:hypothetical protein
VCSTFPLFDTLQEGEGRIHRAVFLSVAAAVTSLLFNHWAVCTGPGTTHSTATYLRRREVMQFLRPYRARGRFGNALHHTRGRSDVPA